VALKSSIGATTPEPGCAGETACAAPNEVGALNSIGSFFATPFVVGQVRIPNRVVLAPMAGISNSAYRRHFKKHGVGLVVTEMVSAYGLIYQNRRTASYLDFSEEERPLAVQLFGDDPKVMRRAAELVLSRPVAPDLIDINMGCPVRKVVRSGAGAALLDDPDRAVAVAAAVVAAATATGVPVTVKLRSGVRMGEKTAVKLAPRLQQVGIAALTVHPRAAAQFYQGVADHSITAEVVKAVEVPVLASGDIRSFHSASEVVSLTGAAAVMVARGVAGDPWLVRSLLAGGVQGRPGLAESVRELRSLLAEAARDMGSARAARWIRRILGWYLKGARVPTPVIEELRRLPDAESLDEALVALLEDR